MSFPRLSSSLAVAVLLTLLPGSERMLPVHVFAQTQQPTQQQDPQKPKTPPAPDSSEGPQTDNGPIVLKKKKDAGDQPPPPPEPKVKNPEGLNNLTLRIDVPVVTVDVSVLLDKNHQFVPGLKPTNFAVFEDGVEQRITDARISKTPITAVMLLEFASTNWAMIQDMQNTAVAFFRSLKADDYIAVVTYDMRTRILTDFTQNKELVAESLRSLVIPGFSETNMFDALYETLDRTSRIDGRKYIVLIGSGRDTFSKITLDDILKKVKATPNVTIFTISTGQLLRTLADSRMGGIRQLDYLQADNEMRTFAQMTGGMWFNPMFPGALPDVFNQIDQSIRNQYVLSFRPLNTKQDGSYRKLKVVLVDQEGKQLRMADEKGKPLKYSVIARDGYRARREVE